jgi:hypothetical protein
MVLKNTYWRKMGAKVRRSWARHRLPVETRGTADSDEREKRKSEEGKWKTGT